MNVLILVNFPHHQLDRGDSTIRCIQPLVGLITPTWLWFSRVLSDPGIKSPTSNFNVFGPFDGVPLLCAFIRLFLRYAPVFCLIHVHLRILVLFLASIRWLETRVYNQTFVVIYRVLINGYYLIAAYYYLLAADCCKQSWSEVGINTRSPTMYTGIVCLACDLFDPVKWLCNPATGYAMVTKNVPWLLNDRQWLPRNNRRPLKARKFWNYCLTATCSIRLHSVFQTVTCGPFPRFNIETTDGLFRVVGSHYSFLKATIWKLTPKITIYEFQSIEIQEYPFCI